MIFHYCLIENEFQCIYLLFQFQEEENVYEDVDESEYSNIVRKRQEDDWIVDDGKYPLKWGS